MDFKYSLKWQISIFFKETLLSTAADFYLKLINFHTCSMISPRFGMGVSINANICRYRCRSTSTGNWSKSTSLTSPVSLKSRLFLNSLRWYFLTRSGFSRLWCIDSHSWPSVRVKRNRSSSSMTRHSPSMNLRMRPLSLCSVQGELSSKPARRTGKSWWSHMRVVRLRERLAACWMRWLKIPTALMLSIVSMSSFWLPNCWAGFVLLSGAGIFLSHFSDSVCLFALLIINDTNKNGGAWNLTNSLLTDSQCRSVFERVLQ